jgi:hypothetical protein
MIHDLRSGHCTWPTRIENITRSEYELSYTCQFVAYERTQSVHLFALLMPSPLPIITIKRAPAFLGWLVQTGSEPSFAFMLC